MGGRVRAVITRVIPANDTHDPLTIPNAARHPPVMAEHSLWRAAPCRTGIYWRRLIPTTTQLAPTAEYTENRDDDFEVETRNNPPGGLSCLRCDSEMCKRRAGTMNWSWRLNVTTWMLNLGTKTRRTELSLLGCDVLPFLGLHVRILCRRHLCRSSPLITNTDRLNLSLVLQ